MNFNHPLYYPLKGEEDTHLFILKWLDSLKYGDLTSGFCYNQKLAMKSEKKKSLLKSKTHEKWSILEFLVNIFKK